MSLSPERLPSLDVIKSLCTNSSSGLSAAEAAQRLEKDGPNALTEKKGRSPIVKFLLQFNDPMIFILLAAAVVSILLREYTDSAIILFVVVLNGIIGYIQESRAEKAIDALKKLSTPHAVVLRDGMPVEIEAAELVVGDIVLLEAGRIVPADLRLIEASNLKIEESALTGESVPVEKNAGFVGEGDLPLGDRVNMAYMTTSVTYGRGVGVVTSTGMGTEIGHIAQILEESNKGMTPLQKRLADLGKVLGILAVALCAVLFLVAVLQKRDIFEMLLTAISLAVAAIPEGLPAVVTIVLAMGVQRMVKSRSIVRRLPAVETLGAVNVVCSDKTGTLTQNRMTVVDCYFNGKTSKPHELNDKAAELFIDGFTLCNDASIEGGQKVGDPTETALLDMSAIFSVTRLQSEKLHPRVNELPFDSDRKMMTTVNAYNDKNLSFTKGALDVIMKHTTHILENGTPREITGGDREQIAAAALSMASKALRVLALACRDSAGEAVEEDLCFIGLVGMIDPPRPEAAAAVVSCRDAGVTTVMITGDHKDTAFAIARDIGIADEPSQCISGDDLNGMTQDELNGRVEKLRVFARVSPEHKVMIVKAFQSHGNIVSMTGDGVNDAPSLKSADIGLAMGITGTDVAKGAADMILTDDNFATIRKAIEEGRNIYNNIKKSTLYLLSSNFGEIITMFFAIIFGWAAPLSPAHILWINLVTDSLPALALGVDPGTPEVMKQKPRGKNESLFSKGGIPTLIIYGLIFGLITLTGFILGCYEAAFGTGIVNFANLGHINFHDAAVLNEGRTFALTVLAVSELVHAIGMRDVNKSLFRMNHLNNLPMWGAVGLGLVLQFVVVQTPVSQIFKTTPLTVWQWLTVLGLALIPLVAHEIRVLINFIRKKDLA